MTPATRGRREDPPQPDPEPQPDPAPEPEPEPAPAQSYEEAAEQGHTGEQPNPAEDLTVDGVTPDPEHQPAQEEASDDA